LRNQNVLITKTVGSFRAKNQLHSSSRFDTILACDGQPDRQTDGQTHDDSIHRASMASRRIRTASFLAIFQLPNVAILMCCSVPEVVFEASTPWPRREVSLNKKLSYRRGTARCVVSVEILPVATQHCRKYL